MSVLIDTSLWIDHFRNGNNVLIGLIEMDLALTHPMILVELACSTPPAPRTQMLGNIGLLRSANQADLTEVMGFIERETLYGLGCGLVDITLLASTLMTPSAKLWTLDKHLEVLANRFAVAYRPGINGKNNSTLSRCLSC